MPEDFLHAASSARDALPPAGQLRQAVELYLRQAYPADPPPSAARFILPETADPAQWLMGDSIERDPADAPLDNVRSFSMRIGNRRYPNMKIKLTRAPRGNSFVFTVDAHDAVLKAPSGSPDAQALQQLKRYNAQLSQEVQAVWDAAGLPTERSYMRQQIKNSRDRNGK